MVKIKILPKLKSHTIPPVLPYNDIEEPQIQLNPTSKIQLKPKHKLLIKPVPTEITTPVPIPTLVTTLVSIPTSDANLIPVPTPILVKLNMIKKNTELTTVYKSQLIDQFPLKKHDPNPTKLTGKINLVTYYDDATAYFIDWESRYIFPSNTHLMTKLPDPIGRLVSKANQSEIPTNNWASYRMRIDWFCYYELDAPAQ